MKGAAPAMFAARELGTPDPFDVGEARKEAARREAEAICAAREDAFSKIDGAVSDRAQAVRSLRTGRASAVYSTSSKAVLRNRR